MVVPLRHCSTTIMLKQFYGALTRPWQSSFQRGNFVISHALPRQALALISQPMKWWPMQTSTAARFGERPWAQNPCFGSMLLAASPDHTLALFLRGSLSCPMGAQSTGCCCPDALPIVMPILPLLSKEPTAKTGIDHSCRESRSSRQRIFAAPHCKYC